MNLPNSFSINKEEKEETDNDRAVTVEQVHRLLKDLFEIVNFDKVALGLNWHWQSGGTDKWGHNFLNLVQVDPYVEMTLVIKKKLNYPESGPYTLGWPAQWRIVEHYMGAGNGSDVYYQGNRNVPDFLIGIYTKENWQKEYDQRLDAEMLKAVTGNRHEI